MRAIAIVSLLGAAACGSAKPAPTVLANKPAPIDAGAAAASEEEVDAAPDEGTGEGEGEDVVYEPTCDSGESQTVIVAGKDSPAHIETCTTGEQQASQTDPGLVYKDRVATLVIEPPGVDPVSHELATWQDGWEDGQSYSLVGVLKSRGRGDGVLLIESSSYGPADGLNGVSAGLSVMAFANGEWQEVHTMSAAVIEVSMSKDGRVATVDTCDPPAKGTGTGCDNLTTPGGYDGDGRTFELRWEGGRVKQRDVTAKP
ncbi:MAG TPA: hypothetical protein VL463_05135 [Kofleriaceae bacterium]|nr:hypothetical protein [Kofleriaceae bacterium]